MNDELSEKDIQQAVKVLSKLQPGFLPFPIFHEITRLTTTSIVEIVPLRLVNETVQILLLKRDAEDPVWSNQLHTPGTVLRATDSLESALKRILNKELGGLKVSQPTFVTNILHNSGRGMEASQVYWVNIIEDTEIGQFYDINQLPESLVKSQLDFIPLAIEDYKSTYKITFAS